MQMMMVPISESTLLYSSKINSIMLPYVEQTIIMHIEAVSFTSICVSWNLCEPTTIACVCVCVTNKPFSKCASDTFWHSQFFYKKNLKNFLKEWREFVSGYIFISKLVKKSWNNDKIKAKYVQLVSGFFLNLVNDLSFPFFSKKNKWPFSET